MTAASQSSTPISLQPITSTNWVTCIELRPTAYQQQRGFVAANVLSLAQAYVDRWWIPTAVYAQQTMVGFILYGCWPAAPIAAEYGQREGGIHHVLRMMIDQHYQGQGYGYAALHRLITHIRAQPDARAIELNYDVDNSVAARLYAQLGFEPTGEVDAGEIRARLVLGVREQ